MTDVLKIDGRAWTAAELAALTEPLHVKGDLDLSKWPHPLPALASIGGWADLRGFQGDLPALASIGGNAYLRGYPHALAALTSIGGVAYLRGYQHALPALASIGRWADLEGYQHALPALTSIGRWAILEGFQGALPPWLIDGGKDSRGYYFTGMLVADEWRIHAGCRDFSLEKARRHWGARGASNRPDCLALVEKIAAEIERRAALKVA